jgi:hypothetical protein
MSRLDVPVVARVADSLAERVERWRTSDCPDVTPSYQFVSDRSRAQWIGRLKASAHSASTARRLEPRKAQAHDEKDPRGCFDPINPRVIPKCIVWTENGRSKQQASHEVVNGN